MLPSSSNPQGQIAIVTLRRNNVPLTRVESIGRWCRSGMESKRKRLHPGHHLAPPQRLFSPHPEWDKRSIEGLEVNDNFKYDDPFQSRVAPVSCSLNCQSLPAATGSRPEDNLTYSSLESLWPWLGNESTCFASSQQETWRKCFADRPWSPFRRPT